MSNDDDIYAIRPVARIHTQFPTKFGVPRQSGLVESLTGTIVFEPEFRNPDALRGIEGFSHLWLVWGFDQARRADGGWTPLVRPPRLGGNAKLGVFATRSPFRPNNLGLSAVVLERVEQTAEHGTVLHVRGADLVDGTPLYDIKPYVPYTDALTNATGGFAAERDQGLLQVACPEEVREMLGEEAQALCDVLARDPRPAFHDDPERVYGLAFSHWDVKFRVDAGTCVVLRAEERG